MFGLSWSVEQISSVSSDGDVDSRTVSKAAHDNGSGAIVRAGAVIGSINYANG